MSTTLPTIERLLEPLTACLTPEVAQRIVDLRLDDPSTLQRLDCLREKATEGTLTDQERAEYEGFVEGNDLVMLIKSQDAPCCNMVDAEAHRLVRQRADNRCE